MLQVYVYVVIQICRVLTQETAQNLQKSLPLLEKSHDLKVTISNRSTYLLFNSSSPPIQLINKELFSHWDTNDSIDIPISKIESLVAGKFPGNGGKHLVALSMFHTNINFKSGQWPVITRKYSAALSNDVLFNQLQLVWLTSSGNKSHFLNLQCFRKGIDYLFGWQWFPNCGTLHHREFSTRSKPWNSEILLHIFPPVSSLLSETNLSKRIVDHLKPEGLPKKFYLLSASAYKCFSLWFHDIRIAAKEQILLSSQTTFQHHIIVGNVNEARVGAGNSDRDKRAEIHTWLLHRDVIHDINHNGPSDHAVAQVLYLDLGMTAGEQNLVCISRYLCAMTQPGFEMMLLWENLKFFSSLNFGLRQHIRAVWNNFNLCWNHLNDATRNPVTLLLLSFQKIEDRLAHLYVHIIQMVIKNFTYVMDSSLHLCVNGKVAEIWDFDESILGNSDVFHRSVTFDQEQNELLGLLPVSVNDRQNALRFIACGRRGVQKYAFDALVSAYDKYTWGLILLVTMIGGFLFQSYQKVPGNQVEALYKILVEQGNPFSNSITSDRKTQFLVATFLLTGILLSNGYKNTNVYRMVTPRLELCYELLSQLIQDSFLIYTRISPNSGFSGRRLSFKKELETVGEPDGPHRKVGEDMFSEVDFYFRKHNDGFILLRDGKRLESLLNNSQLHDNNIVREVIVPRINISAATEREMDWPTITVEMIMEYLTAEATHLFNELKLCQKIALVLPYSMCQEGAASLGKSQPVSIGTETFVQLDYGFRFSGVLPLSLFARIRRLFQSGIQARWENILNAGSNQSLVTTQRGDTNPRPAKLIENILVVFVVFLCGCACSLSSFGWEMYSSRVVKEDALKSRECRARKKTPLKIDKSEINETSRLVKSAPTSRSEAALTRKALVLNRSIPLPAHLHRQRSKSK